MPKGAFLKSTAFDVYQSAGTVQSSNRNHNGQLKEDEIQFGCSFYKDLVFYDLTPLKIFGPRVIN